MRKSDEKFELTGVDFKAETARAVLIVHNEEEHWIPLSQIHELHKAEGRIVMTAWIAKQKGLL